MGLLSDQSPEGRRKRLMVAGGGAVVLALLFLMTRNGGGGEPEGDATSTGIPTTFADNGAAMGQLSENVTDALGTVATGQDNTTTTLEALIESQQALTDALNARPAPTAVAAAGNPTNTATKPKVDQAAVRKVVGSVRREQRHQKAEKRRSDRQQAAARGQRRAAVRQARQTPSSLRPKKTSRSPSVPSHAQKTHKPPHKKR